MQLPRQRRPSTNQDSVNFALPNQGHPERQLWFDFFAFVQVHRTPQKLSNVIMRRSEIEAKFNQFVLVNERLLRFISGEEGPDDNLEECQ